MYLKYIFIILAVVLASLLCVYNLYFQKKKRTEKIASYVSLVTGAILIYVLYSIFCVFVIDGIVNKFILLLFAMSPFIIGHFATDRKSVV